MEAALQLPMCDAGAVPVAVYLPPRLDRPPTELGLAVLDLIICRPGIRSCSLQPIFCPTSGDRGSRCG